MNVYCRKLEYAASVAAWMTDLAEAAEQAGRAEDALHGVYLAGTILTRQNRVLADDRIEALVRRLAHRLPPAPPRERGEREERPRCLHVVTEALPAGGLTVMALRWMELDSSRSHSLALICQQAPVPEFVRDAVERLGGAIHIGDPAASYLHQAAWLRSLAGRCADYVVLHVETADIVGGLAFGAPGGPPVMLVNHAAHIFWNGVTWADRVLNCRGSEYEASWTRHYRGVEQVATVPIPLQPPPATVDPAEPRRRAREALDLPADETVLLTVGSTFKYRPIGPLNFISVCEEVLERIPGSCLVVAGVDPEGPWQDAVARWGGRLRVTGRLDRDVLAAYHRAADVYVEGYPFGSTTALLEAVLAGLPAVLPPADAPPPYASDGVALDDVLERPADRSAYIAQMIELAESSAARDALAARLQASVRRHHTGSGWRQYVEDAVATLPARHGIRETFSAAPTPLAAHTYWGRFACETQFDYAETLEDIVLRALDRGLRPMPNPRLRAACRAAAPIRAGRTIPAPLLVMLCGALRQVSSDRVALWIFRGVAFLFRGRLVARSRARLLGRRGGAYAAPCVGRRSGAHASESGSASARERIS